MDYNGHKNLSFIKEISNYLLERGWV